LNESSDTSPTLNHFAWLLLVTWSYFANVDEDQTIADTQNKCVEKCSLGSSWISFEIENVSDKECFELSEFGYSSVGLFIVGKSSLETLILFFVALDLSFNTLS
jgi:hypothetical protein